MELEQNEHEFTMDEIKPDQTSASLLPGDSLAAIGDIIPLQNVGQGNLKFIQLVNENNEIQFIQCLSSCADGAGGSGLAQLVTGSSTGNGPLIIQPLSTTIKHELGICEDVESHLLSSQHHQNNNETVECMTDDPLPNETDSTAQVDDHQDGVVFAKNAPEGLGAAVVRLDLNRPIALTKDTVVTINDEKCVLRLDPNTSTLVAYPLKDNSASTSKTKSVTKRKRGRPPKAAVKMSTAEVADQSSNLSLPEPSGAVLDDRVEDSEEEKSGAAECLLGLADGRRKSSRIKKMPTQLMDYEIKQRDNSPEAITSEQGTPGAPGIVITLPEIQDDRTRLVVPKIATPNQMQNFLANLGLPVKRGRGRPRRKPLHVSSDVQRFLPTLLPKLSPVTITPVSDETTIIIRQDDGAEKHIIVSSASSSSLGFTPLTSDVQNDLSTSLLETGEDIESIEPAKEIHTTAGSCEEILVPSNVFRNSTASHSLPVKIGPKLKEDDLLNLQCVKCGFHALYANQLQEHIAAEHCSDGDELYKCKCCTYLSLTNEGLISHFQECHPKCLCTVCGFMAEHSYIVKRHMQRHDSSGCECSVCGKRYKDQYILKMHFKMVHMPAEVLFQCQVCLKMFTRKAHLKRHLRIHNPDKPFKCPHCEYRGCERSDINKHLLIHNEPKYSCEICLKTFRHLKNKELHVRRHQGQRDYTCGTCGFRGYTYTDIRKHIERKHVELHSVCNRCGVTFKSDSVLNNMREHLCDVILLEQALEDTGNEAGEECYSNDVIQLVTDQSLLNDPHQVIIASNSVDISLETLALPDESLQLMETELEQEQIIGEV